MPQFLRFIALGSGLKLYNRLHDKNMKEAQIDRAYLIEGLEQFSLTLTPYK